MGSKFSKQGSAKVRTLAGPDGTNKLLSLLANLFYIRSLVSKKRRRMLVAGYDLDMSYITDHLLAMSYPAERMRAMYRNPLWQVKTVLDMRHPDCYKVYNLCAEESYNTSHFDGRVEVFPFDDNHVPPLSLIKLFCENIYSWLSQDPHNIAVVHCMAGKGRTGLMVCAYLVYGGMSADEALQLYASRRTTNNEGVSGQLYRPSVEVARGCCRQIKHGYHRACSPRYYLSFIDGDSDGDNGEGETPHYVVQMDTESSAIYRKTCLDYHFDKPLQVTGDLRVIFYEKMIGGRLFYVCFNTAFIRSSLLQFKLRDLDKAGGKGKSVCGLDFCMELLFCPANAVPSTERQS